MVMLCDVGVVLFLRIYKCGCLITYKSINRQSWPPTEEQLVRALQGRHYHTNKAVATQVSDPVRIRSRCNPTVLWN
jgi:hypothetical protein